MDALQRQFGSESKDLAPGIPNRDQVVKDRMIYRSAKKDPLRKGSKTTQDERMEVTPPGSKLPLEEVPTRKKSPEKKADPFAMPLMEEVDKSVNEVDEFITSATNDVVETKSPEAKSSKKSNAGVADKDVIDDMPMVVDNEGGTKRKDMVEGTVRDVDDGMSINTDNDTGSQQKDQETKKTSKGSSAGLMNMNLS